MSNDSALFPRSFHQAFPVAVRGEGCWLFAADGGKFLDGAGQAAVINIGHGVPEIGRAMAEQSSKLAFAHTSQFHTPSAEKLAARLLSMAPPNFRKGGRVYFTSGGSEATETAIKLARQYYLEKGQPARYRILSRRQSYHGSTLGAMTVSGNVARRAPYRPLLAEWGHIAPCFCYHCPFEKTFPQCHLACADDLDSLLVENDTDAAAFVFEPVVGATLGAVVPPEGYTARVAEICRQRGILLIADEVMSGIGRTGRAFAVQHWGIEPDIILAGKGIASGYAPLGAVLVAPNVVEAVETGTRIFKHGFTYQAHAVATAAGNAVLDYIETHSLFARVAPASQALCTALAPLLSHRHVGDIRGLGLLVGIEFVRDKPTRAPFEPSLAIAEKIRAAAMEEGVLTYPTQGCVDGASGDHILLAPPFIITPEESALIPSSLASALAKVFPD